jgi:hypothetical protein
MAQSRLERALRTAQQGIEHSNLIDSPDAKRICLGLITWIFKGGSSAEASYDAVMQLLIENIVHTTLESCYGADYRRSPELYDVFRRLEVFTL